MMNNAKRPTGEQCEQTAELSREAGRVCFATYHYPQMGGYCAPSIVSTGGIGECFDAEIWHDGQFPFGEEREPVKLHHCCAAQFIEFGLLVLEKQVSLGVGRENGEHRAPYALSDLERIQGRISTLIDGMRKAGIVS